MALLGPDLLRRLAAFTLRSSRRRPGAGAGQRRSSRRGQSQEFADHRPYAPGDDLRFLDWHVYGRLDALWIKLFEAEEDRAVQLLVDCSASMQGDKLDYARQVAAALGYVALQRGDRVSVSAVSDKLTQHSPSRRGRTAATPLFSSLEQIHPGGASDPGRAIDALPRHRGAGIALLFTDLLYPEGPEPALRRLRARGDEVHLFHLLGEAELRPSLRGDVTLVDAETGATLATTIDDAALARYHGALRDWLERSERAARALGVGYTRTTTDTPLDDFVLRDLDRAGLVRR